jgi:hypothetical protein
MDRDHDMDHVRSAGQLRNKLTTQESWPSEIYGDTIGGHSFSDKESEILIAAEKRHRPVTGCGWREVWHNLHVWTIINCRLETQEEIDIWRDAMADQAAEIAECEAQNAEDAAQLAAKPQPHQARCTRALEPEDPDSAKCGRPCPCWCTDALHQHCICESCHDETEEGYLA